MIPAAPPTRVIAQNDRPERPAASFVLYWMLSQRRTRYNFGLQHALHLAERWGRPLLVLEALRVGHRWASARTHRFVLDGMADNARRFDPTNVAYWPYVEPAAGHGRGLLLSLAERACAVVTDEFPVFFLPKMVTVAAARCPVRLWTVDGNGVLPLRAADRAFSAAVHYRRHAQRSLRDHLLDFPLEDPLSRAAIPRAKLPADLAARWPAATPLLQGGSLAALPIDHAVSPVATRGGSSAASAKLSDFLENRLSRYLESRADAAEDCASGLSPFLHFGHIAAHEVLSALWSRADWTPAQLAPKATGRREGWWGLDAATEAFVDQLVIWRELSFNNSFFDPDGHDRYAGLPAWARQTLSRHAADPRPRRYSPEVLAAARTADPLWNAAQTQLLREGRIHNYLRMLWGKKVLEWTEDPQSAFETLLDLNNRYALDGRDPNSSAGVAWVFGRYDHPWPPERPIFGTVRVMKSENTARKMSVHAYLERYGSR